MSVLPDAQASRTGANGRDWTISSIAVGPTRSGLSCSDPASIQLAASPGTILPRYAAFFDVTLPQFFRDQVIRFALGPGLICKSLCLGLANRSDTSKAHSKRIT